MLAPPAHDGGHRLLFLLDRSRRDRELRLHHHLRGASPTRSGSRRPRRATSSVPPSSLSRSTQRVAHAGTPPCPSRAPRRSCAPRRRPSPGTPTAHDSPDHPASATRRASTGRASAAPARTTAHRPAAVRRRSPASGSSQRRRSRAPRCSTTPSKPASDDQQVGASADDEDRDRQHRQRPVAGRRTDGLEVGRSLDLDEERGRATHAVGGQRSQRLHRASPGRPGASARASQLGTVGAASPLRRLEQLVGQGRQVPGAQGEAEVARDGAAPPTASAQLLPTRRVGHRQPRVLRPDGVGDQAARDPGHRRARRRCRRRSPPARRRRRRRSRTAPPAAAVREKRCGWNTATTRDQPPARAVARAARTSRAGGRSRRRR